MIDGYAIMQSFKELLDADATLNTALGSRPGNSKILLGGTLPSDCSLPLILIHDPIYRPEARRNDGEFDQEVTIWNGIRSDGMEDFENIYSLTRQVVDLLSGGRIKTTTTVLSSLRLVEAESTTIVGRSSVKVLHFMGLAGDVS